MPATIPSSKSRHEDYTAAVGCAEASHSRNGLYRVDRTTRGYAPRLGNASANRLNTVPIDTSPSLSSASSSHVPTTHIPPKNPFQPGPEHHATLTPSGAPSSLSVASEHAGVKGLQAKDRTIQSSTTHASLPGPSSTNTLENVSSTAFWIPPGISIASRYNYPRGAAVRASGPVQATDSTPGDMSPARTGGSPVSGPVPNLSGIPTAGLSGRVNERTGVERSRLDVSARTRSSVTSVNIPVHVPVAGISSTRSSGARPRSSGTLRNDSRTSDRARVGIASAQATSNEQNSKYKPPDDRGRSCSHVSQNAGAQMTSEDALAREKERLSASAASYTTVMHHASGSLPLPPSETIRSPSALVARGPGPSLPDPQFVSQSLRDPHALPDFRYPDEPRQDWAEEVAPPYPVALETPPRYSTITQDIPPSYSGSDKRGRYE